MLELDSVGVVFRSLVALEGVSLSVPDGQIVGLVGPNGAGKTTLLNAITGVYRPTSGRVVFDGVDLTAIGRHRLLAAGVSRTYQNIALFGGLSVLDNVLVGGSGLRPGGLLTSALRIRPSLMSERRARGRARELLRRFDLDSVREWSVDRLPYGVLKRVELARALAGSPRLLLLDEPAAGLSHTDVGQLGEELALVRDQEDLTLVVVEHHMGLIASLCHRVVALASGRLLADGTPAEVAADPAVIEAYLGSAA